MTEERTESTGARDRENWAPHVEHLAADGGVIARTEAAMAEYALGLRITVAFAVGVAIVAGVFRIVRGYGWRPRKDGKLRRLWEY